VLRVCAVKDKPDIKRNNTTSAFFIVFVFRGTEELRNRGS